MHSAEIDPDILQLFTEGFFYEDMEVEKIQASTSHCQDTDSDFDEAALNDIDLAAKSKGTLRNEAWSIKKFEG